MYVEFGSNFASRSRSNEFFKLQLKKRKESMIIDTLLNNFVTNYNPFLSFLLTVFLYLQWFSFMIFSHFHTLFMHAHLYKMYIFNIVLLGVCRDAVKVSWLSTDTSHDSTSWYLCYFRRSTLTQVSSGRA